MNQPKTLDQNTAPHFDNKQDAPKNALDNSTKRVLRQLLEALLFEGHIPLNKNEGNWLRFQVGKSQYKAQGKVCAFDRIRLVEDSMARQVGDQWYFPQVTQLIDDLLIPSQVKAPLLKELEQTIRLCQWNAQHLPSLPSRRHLSYRELESAIHEGHPYHPCFKARTGFSLEDHIQYGPEFGNNFQLQWLAVRRDLVKCRLGQRKTTSSLSDQVSDEYHFWQRELGQNCWDTLGQRLREQQGQWQNYCLLPLHPWQWQYLQNKLAQALAHKQVIDLGFAGDFYQASISVRTLINTSHPEKANIKLPLNMVNSSSLRTLEAHSICTAPLISQWLKETINGDRFFQDEAPMEILREYAGINLDSNKTANTELASLKGQLGVIFRESVEQKHAKDKTLPFVAIAAIEEDGQPFIHPWVTAYGCEPWLDQLIKTSVIPIWHLLTHHGIAIETHAQNMILAHQNGWPQKVILRDFHESLEYVESYVAAPQKMPDFKSLEPCYHNAKPNQYYWMESIEALRELFMDTLFVFNLSELSTLMEKHYQFSEDHFWKRVYSQLDAYQQQGYTDKKRIDPVGIDQAFIHTESLMAKKISGRNDKEFHHKIFNTLSRQALTSQ